MIERVLRRQYSRLRNRKGLPATTRAVHLRSWPGRPLPTTTEHTDCVCWWCQRDTPKVSTATPASGAPRPAWKYAGRYRDYVRQWHVDRMQPSRLRLSDAAPIQGLLALLDDDEDRPEPSPLIWTTDPQSQRVPFSAANAKAWHAALHIEARAPIVSFQGFLPAHKTVLAPERESSRTPGYRVRGADFWCPDSWEKLPEGEPIRNEFGSVIGHERPLIKTRPHVELDGARGYLRNGSLAYSEERLLQEYDMEPKTKRVERVVLRIDPVTKKKFTVLNENGNFLTEWVEEEVESAVLHEYRMRCGHGGYPPREAWFSKRTPQPPEFRSYTLVAPKVYRPDWECIAPFARYTRDKNQREKLLKRRDEIVTLLRQLGEEHDRDAVEAQLASGPIGTVMSQLLARFYAKQRELRTA